jgi:hypothetical protein
LLKPIAVPFITINQSMRLLSCIAFLALVCLCASCTEDDTASGVPHYVNKLTLGTGANASNSGLTGESTTFRGLGGVTVIYWRLESAADFGGVGLSLKIEKRSGSTYTTIGTYPYASQKNYGHVIVSSISLADAGTFRATGLLTATSAEVASTVFTVQW